MTALFWGQRLCRIAFGIGVIAIAVLSLLPASDMPDVHMSDKIGHTLAYGCVMLAGGLGFWLQRQRLQVAGGLFLLGIAMELLQSLMPTRQMSLLDIAANTVGIAAGLLLCLAATRHLQRRGSNRV